MKINIIIRSILVIFAAGDGALGRDLFPARLKREAGVTPELCPQLCRP